jgi:hypothetical protein
MMGRTHRHYVIGDYWRGEDLAGHAAAQAVGRYFLTPQDGGDRLGGAFVEIERLQRELMAAAKQISVLEDRLRLMETSTSWRVTKGLRALRRAMPGYRAKRRGLSRKP